MSISPLSKPPTPEPTSAESMSGDADDRMDGGSAVPAATADAPLEVCIDSSQQSMGSIPVAAHTPCGQDMSSGPKSSEEQDHPIDSSQAAGAAGRVAADVGGQVHAQAEDEDLTAPLNVLGNGAKATASASEKPPGSRLRALPGGGQPLGGSAIIGESCLQPDLISDRCAT